MKTDLRVCMAKTIELRTRKKWKTFTNKAEQQMGPKSQVSFKPS